MTQSAYNDLAIQPLTAKDVESAAALQPDGWGDILAPIRFYSTSPFCRPLKAMIHDQVVGIGTAIIHGSTAWLAHIIVAKNHRNAGIGAAITQSLIDLIRSMGCETMLLLATPLGEPVYKRLGFNVEGKYVFLDHGNLPAPAKNKNIIAFDQRYRQAFLDFDKRVSGETREKLFNDHLTKSRLFLQEGEITGFYMPTLGDGLIISNDPIAGIELMKHRWNVNKMFCLPLDNVEGINFLEKHGYKRIREASRMTLGRKINWDGSKIYSRIGGNLG